jgi:hypothetical protein
VLVFILKVAPVLLALAQLLSRLWYTGHSSVFGKLWPFSVILSAGLLSCSNHDSEFQVGTTLCAAMAWTNDAIQVAFEDTVGYVVVRILSL